MFGDVLFKEGYVLGGADATPDIEFGDAPLPMFENPPKCWLHRQASFINAFFPEDAVAGEDYDWFPFPPIDQEGTLYAGELTVVGTNGNRPEVKDFLDQFIDQAVQCEMGGVQPSSRISPNVNVGAECYANDILADASVVLTEALTSGTGRFDASDLMPAEVGSGSFWTGMVEYTEEGPECSQGPRRDRVHLASLRAGDTWKMPRSGRQAAAPSARRRRRASTRDVTGRRARRRPCPAGLGAPHHRELVLRVAQRWRRRFFLADVRLPPRRERQPALVVLVAIVVGVGGVFALYWAMNQLVDLLPRASAKACGRTSSSGRPGHPGRLPRLPSDQHDHDQPEGRPGPRVRRDSTTTISCSPTRACCGRSATRRGGSSSCRCSR